MSQTPAEVRLVYGLCQRVHIKVLLPNSLSSALLCPLIYYQLSENDSVTISMQCGQLVWTIRTDYSCTCWVSNTMNLQRVLCTRKEVCGRMAESFHNSWRWFQVTWNNAVQKGSAVNALKPLEALEFGHFRLVRVYGVLYLKKPIPADNMLCILTPKTVLFPLVAARPKKSLLELLE